MNKILVILVVIALSILLICGTLLLIESINRIGINKEITQSEQLIPAEHLIGYTSVKGLKDIWNKIEKSNFYNETNKIEGIRDVWQSYRFRKYRNFVDNIEKKANIKLGINDFIDVFGESFVIANFESKKSNHFLFVTKIGTKTKVIADLITFGKSSKDKPFKYNKVEINKVNLSGSNFLYSLIGNYIIASNDTSLIKNSINLALGITKESLYKTDGFKKVSGDKKFFILTHYSYNEDAEKGKRKLLSLKELTILTNVIDSGLSINVNATTDDESKGLIDSGLYSKEIGDGNDALQKIVKITPQNILFLSCFNSFDFNKMWNYFRNDWIKDEHSKELSANALDTLENDTKLNIKDDLISKLTGKVFIASNGVTISEDNTFAEMAVGFEISNKESENLSEFDKLFIYLFSKERELKKVKHSEKTIYYFGDEKDDDSSSKFCYTYLDNILILSNSQDFLKKFIDSNKNDAVSLFQNKNYQNIVKHPEIDFAKNNKLFFYVDGKTLVNNSADYVSYLYNVGWIDSQDISDRIVSLLNKCEFIKGLAGSGSIMGNDININIFCSMTK